MSKTIDAIKRPDVRSRIHQPIHDEIADTYFKPPAPPEPARPRKFKNTPKLPWVIAILAVIAAIGVLLSRSTIDIRVRVLGEEAPTGAAGASAAITDGSRGKSAHLLKGAEINNVLIKETLFSGDAKAYSRLTGSGVVLCNSGGSGWASYTMQFKEPFDMTGLVIDFRAMGEKGGEMLGVAITDSGNRTYRIEKDLSPKMGLEEKEYTADFGPAKRMLDLANISAIRFEFGSLTMENRPMATIFLNAVRASKKKRTGWL